MIDVPLDYHAELDDDLAERTGYRIDRHRTVFEGLCPACQAREANSTKDPENPA